MSAETVIGILVTALLSETAFGLAWVIKVSGFQRELQSLKEAVYRLESKVHDSPCSASQANDKGLAVLEQRVGQLEERAVQTG